MKRSRLFFWGTSIILLPLGILAFILLTDKPGRDAAPPVPAESRATKVNEDSISEIDTTPPVVTFTPQIERSGAPWLTGRLDDPSAKVFVDIRDGVGSVHTNLIARTSGESWSLQVPSPLTDGVYAIEVRAVDDAENSSTAAGSLTIDATPPVVTVAYQATDNPTPTLTGTLDDPSATVTVEILGAEHEVDEVHVTGNTWRLVWPTPLAVGSYDVLVIAEDAASNRDIDNAHDGLVILAAPLVTLTGTQPETPTSVKADDTMMLRWSVTVNGGDADGTWVDNVFWSRDEVFGRDDLRAHPRGFRAGPVSAGLTYSVNLELRVPDIAPGAYYLLVRSDVYGDLPRVSRENGIAPIRVTVLDSRFSR